MTYRSIILALGLSLAAQSAKAEPCAKEDTDCLLTSLLKQTYELEACRSRDEFLFRAEQDAERLASNNDALARAYKKQLDKAEAPPSRMKWFLLGAAGALALTLGIVIANH